MSATRKNNTATKENTTLAANEAVTVQKSQAASYDIAKSDETLDLAKDLAKFIADNRLSTQVQGKEFVNVEGWQYAGSRLGIVPIVEHVINCSTDQEIKYQAKVTLFDMRSQHTVGAGFAICSNKESGRKFYQEFAIASMAQTRAIGKAYRNILAWIIRAAGYEPTPAEEMEYAGNTPAPAAQAPAVPVGNAPAASEPQPLMRAVSNSESLEASTGSDQSTSQVAGPAVIPAEVIAKLTRQFEAATSGIDVKTLWDKLTGNEKKALFDAKETAKARVAEAGQTAAAVVARTQPAPMKEAGADASLVAEFCEQPAVAGVEFVPATGEQKQTIARLLDHPLITRREKTQLLLRINKLDKERARQAIIKLRNAIDEREGTNPAKVAGLRELLHKQLNEYGGVLGEEIVAEYSILVENTEATIEQLRAALAEVREVLSVNQDNEEEVETAQAA